MDAAHIGDIIATGGLLFCCSAKSTRVLLSGVIKYAASLLCSTTATQLTDERRRGTGDKNTG